MPLKEKFENINLDAIPEHISFELETIKEETDNFTDEDGLAVFEKEFNYLYNIIKKKYPTALNDYVAPPPPPPTAEEIASALMEKERVEKEEAERVRAEEERLKEEEERLRLEEEARIEAERIKQEKIEKANALLDKAKKFKPAVKPAEVEE